VAAATMVETKDDDNDIIINSNFLREGLYFNNIV